VGNVQPYFMRESSHLRRKGGAAGYVIDGAGLKGAASELPSAISLLEEETVKKAVSCRDC